MGHRELAVLKELFPSKPVIPLSLKETEGFFQKIFLQSNFCDLQTDHRKN